MLCYVLFCLTAGIEGGVHQPIIGFNDLHPGVAFCIHAETATRPADLQAELLAVFHEGLNRGYSVALYGIRFGITKNRWLIAPDIRLGIDYLARELDPGRESGLAFGYAAGIRFAIRRELLMIYPALFYEGVTDFKTHAGFLGIRLGVAHEI